MSKAKPKNDRTNQKSRIKQLFDTGISQAATVLERARMCAQLSKPWLLPPEGHTEADQLPRNFQSVGSRGLTNLEGKMLLALFPPSTPWFQLRVSQAVQMDERITPEDKEKLAQALYLREVAMLATLESANTAQGGYVPSTFRSAKRTALSQLLGTGDVLEQLTDDYRLKVFRRDQYVTKRNSAREVIYHVICEHVDLLTLKDEELIQAWYKPGEVAEMDADKRVQPLYTLVEWKPREKVWKIEQELNGVVIRTSEERVSPFFCTSYELMSGDNYGRGIVETNLGDLAGLDGLEERLLDIMGAAAKVLFGIDENSNVRPKDLEKRSGSIIRCKVGADGRARDIATISHPMQREFTILDAGIKRKSGDLAKAFLMEGELQPNGERVTRYQVQRIAQELEGALGGVYAPIAEYQQIPLLARLEFQMNRDTLMPPIPHGVVSVETVTGIEALGREQVKGRLIDFVQIVAQLGPEAMARIKTNVLINILARYSGLKEPGLIKTDQEVADEQQKQMQQMVAAQAAAKTVDTLGNAAEARLTQQGAPTP